MADYTSDKISAYNDIRAAGVLISVRRKTVGTYNPSLDIMVAASAQLNGAIDNAITTLTLQTEVGTFPVTNGVIWIDREKMSYTTKVLLVLSGIVRGIDGTTARAHIDLSNIYAQADATYTDYNQYAVITDVKNAQLDEDTIRHDDRKILMPAYNLNIEPTQADTIIIGSEEFVISIIKRVAPNNDPILYKIYTRKAVNV
jgi:hypothetical protein